MEIQERFSFQAEELREGDTLLCERLSKTEWRFVNKFGWMTKELPEGASVSVATSGAAIPPGFDNSNHVSQGKIVSRQHVSVFRVRSNFFPALQAPDRDGWTHDDLKFWDGDLVTIISLVSPSSISTP